MKIIVDNNEVDNVKLKFDNMQEMSNFGCMMHAVPSVGALSDGETWSITNIKAKRPKFKTIAIKLKSLLISEAINMDVEKNFYSQDEIFCNWYTCYKCKDTYVRFKANYCAKCGVKFNWL